MTQRSYYSLRTGKNKYANGFDLEIMKKLFLSCIGEMEEKGFLQEEFGIFCTDGYIEGSLGKDIEALILRTIRKDNLWPINKKISKYSEDDLFDIIEFLYDHISCPLEGNYHGYNDCGMHYEKFDKEQGRDEYLTYINPLLKDYGEGFTLSKEGEIIALSDPGLDILLNTPLPQYDPENVELKIESAICRFRRHRSTSEDKRIAMRELADVFEFLRPKVKDVLTSNDENDLYNIINNFAIRHHNPQQKSDYDPAWLGWMFFFYLATIHTCLRRIKIAEKNG